MANQVIPDSPILLVPVSEDQDVDHPKVREVVNSTVRAWESGQKSLIFCFRVNTAGRLKEIIEQKIREKLDARRKSCLGGEEKVKFLRARLTSRDGDLISVGLDRVLLSFVLAGNGTDTRPIETDLKGSDAQKRRHP